ncbi:hypothetical protein [Alloactinosynnema sp. L-07]|uniref:hypothetical protein n=1 Tax=Alloactinosynnema sp. L-07 TaxID=1653480 RepID=UPI0006B43F00|nr:hypothetical protein [Alloactinosynnema sp. L-07]
MKDAAEWLARTSADFVVALRSNEGFRRDLFERLVSALEDCAVEWAGRDCIPRLAANVLVELVVSVQAAADAYEGPLRQEILDASYELFDLVVACVGVDASDV